jgi:putative NADPH-quinone reductase
VTASVWQISVWLNGWCRTNQRGSYTHGLLQSKRVLLHYLSSGIVLQNFSLEIQDIKDTEILTMYDNLCKGLMNQPVSTLSGVRSEYDDDDDYNSKVMAHYICSHTHLFNCEME